MYVYQFHFDSVRDGRVRLERFLGQPILLVNTASESRHTEQLRKLQKLWENYRHRGLVLIGLPCDEFGHREPLDDSAIEEAYADRFGVTFPLTIRQSFRGRTVHPLFLALRESLGRTALPRWNFFKYLFDVHGDLAQRWPSRTEPDDPVVTHAIERNLRSWII